LAQRFDFSHIKKMLNKCAEGWSMTIIPHFRRIHYNGRSGILPKNEDEIYAQKVKKMFRETGVSPDCLEKHFGLSIGLPTDGTKPVQGEKKQAVASEPVPAVPTKNKQN